MKEVGTCIENKPCKFGKPTLEDGAFGEGTVQVCCCNNQEARDAMGSDIVNPDFGCIYWEAK